MIKLRIYYVILFLFTLLLYGNTLKNQYSLDDEYVIKDNLKTHMGISGIPEIFKSHYVTNKNANFEYRPLVQTSFALEYGLWKTNPFLSHLVNILLYYISLVIVFLILKKIFPEFHLILIFSIVLLYAAFPAHNEVVASLKNRDELLSALFGFLYILFVLYYIDKKKLWFLVFSSIFVGLGMLSKKSILAFPMLLVLIFIFFQKVTKKEFFLTVIFTLLGILILYYLTKRYYLTSSAGRFVVFYENPLFEIKGMLVRFYLMLNTLFFYFKLTVYPHHLLFYYGYNTIPYDINFEAIFAGVVTLTILIVSAIKIKSKSPLAFGLLFYLTGILIYTNVFKLVTGIVAVRFLHVAILGFIIFLVFGLKKILKLNFEKNVKISFRSHMVFFLICISILGLYSFKTIDKNKYWYNKLTLFEHDIKFLKNSAKANQLIGTEYMIEANKFRIRGSKKLALENAEKARKYLKRAVEIFPEENECKSNLGYLYMNYFHKMDSANYYFLQVSTQRERDLQTFQKEAQNLLVHKDTVNAIKIYKNIIHRDSGNVDTYNNLSKLYFILGENKKGIKLNQILINKNLGSDLPYINLANHYYLSGDIEKGIQYAELALTKNPNNVKVCNKISAYYFQKGNNTKGEYYLKMARKAYEKDSVFNSIVNKYKK